MKFQSIIFDMDGTLVDSLMLWDVLWEKLGTDYLSDKMFRPNDSDDKAVRTLPLDKAMDLIHDHYHIGKNGAELLKTANTLMEDFYSSQVQLKPGVKEFLEHCYKNGTNMCIASATVPYLIKIALKHCEIEKYFSKIFSCGEIGKGKESPDVFLMASDFLGTHIQETWVFEDSCVAIKTAAEIGMKTVGIYDKFNYGQEEIKKTATVYIDEGESLDKLIANV